MPNGGYFLYKYYCLSLISSQACEHDVLLSVIRWGEAQVIRRMNEQGV